MANEGNSDYSQSIDPQTPSITLKEPVFYISKRFVLIFSAIIFLYSLLWSYIASLLIGYGIFFTGISALKNLSFINNKFLLYFIPIAGFITFPPIASIFVVISRKQNVKTISYYFFLSLLITLMSGAAIWGFPVLFGAEKPLQFEQYLKQNGGEKLILFLLFLMI